MTQTKVEPAMKKEEKIKSEAISPGEAMNVLRRVLDKIEKANPGQIQGALLGLSQKIVDAYVSFPDQLTRASVAFGYLEIALDANVNAVPLREKFIPLETMATPSDVVN